MCFYFSRLMSSVTVGPPMHRIRHVHRVVPRIDQAGPATTATKAVSPARSQVKVVVWRIVSSPTPPAQRPSGSQPVSKSHIASRYRQKRCSWQAIATATLILLDCVR